MLRHAGAMSVSGGEFPRHLAGLVFSDRDEFHLRRDDAFAGIVNLSDVFPGLGTERLTDMLEAQLVEPRIAGTHPAILGGDIRELLDIPTRQNPFMPRSGESRSDINLDGRVCVRT